MVTEHKSEKNGENLQIPIEKKLFPTHELNDRYRNPDSRCGNLEVTSARAGVLGLRESDTGNNGTLAEVDKFSY